MPGRSRQELSRLQGHLTGLAVPLQGQAEAPPRLPYRLVRVLLGLAQPRQDDPADQEARTTAERVAQRKVGVSAVQTEPTSTEPSASAPADPAAVKKASLREQAMADSGVQAFLDVFPAEIRDVEEM